MSDIKPEYSNIKGLLQDVSLQMDHRMRELRVGTPFEHVRPADAKTFMLISRQSRTVSGLARVLSITRQAAHNSVLRLIEHDVVKLSSIPGNKRDKLVSVSAQGKRGQVFAARKLKVLEKEIVEKIGKRKLEQLRKILLELVD